MKKLKQLGVLIAAILGGIFYRMGGSGNYPRWIREAGQGVCAVVVMLFCGLIHWSLVLCFGVCWLESTYFKQKGTNAKWWNWSLVGAVFGLVPFPYCVAMHSHWIGFSIRFPICVLGTIFWQEYLSDKVAKLLHLGKDITDEFGRGFINIATIPLLLIG